MSPYLLLKTLHILTATLLFGTGLGSAYYAWRAWRSGQLQVIATTFRHLVSADWLFIATSAVFQPLSGLGLAYWAGWPLAQGWLLWSLGLAAVEPGAVRVRRALLVAGGVAADSRARPGRGGDGGGNRVAAAGLLLYALVVRPGLAGVPGLPGDLLADGQQAAVRRLSRAG